MSDAISETSENDTVDNSATVINEPVEDISKQQVIEQSATEQNNQTDIPSVESVIMDRLDAIEKMIVNNTQPSVDFSKKAADTAGSVEVKELSDDEFESVMSSKEAFHKYMSGVVTSVTAQVLKNVSATVMEDVSKEANNQRVFNEYMKKNPDFVGYERLISDQASLLGSSRPDLKRTPAFEVELSKRVRSIIQATQRVNTSKKSSIPSPTGANTRKTGNVEKLTMEDTAFADFLVANKGGVRRK